MKKVFCLLMIVVAMFAFSACISETKTLTCDGCGKQVEMDADSGITDEWILFCRECGEPEIKF